MNMILEAFLLVFCFYHEKTLAKSILHNVVSQQQNSFVTDFDQNPTTLAVIESIRSYTHYIQNLSDVTLEAQREDIKRNIQLLKSQIDLKQKGILSKTGATEHGRSIVEKCLIEGELDDLAVEANNQIKKCAKVALAEMTNVISDSINEAQSFMTIPVAIGKSIESCGLSRDCLLKITSEAISESVQVTPKVMSLASKIQTITLRTVISINTCGFEGIENIVNLGMAIIEDILHCLQDEVDALLS